MVALPSRLERLIGTSPEGPNCWNATQMFYHHRFKQRHTTAREMNTWLKNKTRKVEDLRPGDLLVFHDKYRLLHTAVYLEKRKYFQKYGIFGKYEITSKKQVIQAYGSDWIIHRLKRRKKRKIRW